MRVRLRAGSGSLLKNSLIVSLPGGVQIQFARGYDNNGSPGFYADVPPNIGIGLVGNLGAFEVGGDARPLNARLSLTNSYPQVTPAVQLIPPAPPPSFVATANFNLDFNDDFD